MIRSLRFGAIVFLFLGLVYIYLLPGSQALLEGRTDTVMSDDTDPAALPYLYDQVIETWKKHPSRLFFGSVYIDAMDPGKGLSAWMSWSERFSVVAASQFIPLEQISTFVVCVMLLLNALSMFLLTRYLGWNLWTCIALSFAWAICPFTRARAKVHMAMAGIYHLPLIFLALLLIGRGRGRRSLLAASVALVLACTNNHYFVITALFCSPLFLAFLFAEPQDRSPYKLRLGRLAVAALPALAFLAFCFTHPVPPEAKISAAQSLPPTGQTPDGGLHPYLNFFSAHLIDYFGGDIALQTPPSDLNPLRRIVNDHIVAGLGPYGNTHERTNGIRWIVLALSIASFIGLRRSSDRRVTAYFGLFGLFSFLLSLGPDTLGAALSPSAWLYSLVSQIRVPSRAGIQVHFAALILAGIWLAREDGTGRLATRVRRVLLLPAVLLVLFIVDYPPLVQSMPMTAMRPAYRELQRDKGACGAGMYFPFVSNSQLSVLYYSELQRLRGSDCINLDSTSDPRTLTFLEDRFPATLNFLDGLEHNLVVEDQLHRLVRCVPLTWIAFDSHTPPGWRQRICGQLGWSLNSDLTCVARDKGLPMEKMPDQCL